MTFTLKKIPPILDQNKNPVPFRSVEGNEGNGAIDHYWLSYDEYSKLDEVFCQRDTEGSDLKSPKLEKGPDTFCDIIEKLYHTGKQGKEIQLVLAGYNRQYVINRLRETCSNLEVLYFERIPGQHLNALYNCLDLYVVSSRIEGGPQALVEASLARCPIVSTDVGIATEILPPESIYSDADDFHLAVPNVEVAYKNALKLAPDTDIFEKYKKMFYGS